MKVDQSQVHLQTRNVPAGSWQLAAEQTPKLLTKGASNCSDAEKPTCVGRGWPVWVEVLGQLTNGDHGVEGGERQLGQASPKDACMAGG